MEIKQKISVHFTVVVAILFAFSLTVICLLFASFRKDDFNDRLSNKALSIAQLIAETENIDPNLLKRIEKNNPTSLPKEKILVFNDKYEIIYSSGQGNNGFNVDFELIQHIKHSKEVYLKNGFDELKGLYYKGNSKNVLVVCSARDVFGHKKLKKLRTILIIVFSLNLVLIYFLGKIFASRALKPISKIIQQINNIDGNNLQQRISANPGKDEISTLANSFNLMLDKLEHTMKTQKEFIANASHELRTPLTTITGNLEVTLLQERSNQEYKQSVTFTLDEVKSLNRLTNRLLTLLRTGTAMRDNTFASVRVDDILWKARSEHLKKNKEHNVQILFDDSIQGEQCFQYIGNAGLLKTAFLNLIDNGCKYSSNNKVDILFSVRGNCLKLIFKDTGIGIPEGELNKIAQPFYRASNVKKQKGHGIGMSLVERIISLHDGSLNIFSVVNKGTTISISLPL